MALATVSPSAGAGPAPPGEAADAAAPSIASRRWSAAESAASTPFFTS
eukprot:CAMPEP_0206056940 /NCGR_PEP_ID=MMETSP1466-20131121/43277_1 /ASSEMBLY_ACC=CAM_ASM_001126 /TAXON_ID=44452 /ORGANISM="Pavlova gyrans, Strain CCMP608" /LENGTH=47 /DNA_ID= /DNA_START= /DNA_END= /DNA_ORIENTATION=